MEKILLIFIVNPNAGRKKGSRIWKKVERFLVRRKIEYEWYMTVESGDAKKIAANVKKSAPKAEKEAAEAAKKIASGVKKAVSSRTAKAKKKTD